MGREKQFPEPGRIERDKSGRQFLETQQTQAQHCGGQVLDVRCHRPLQLSWREVACEALRANTAQTLSPAPVPCAESTEPRKPVRMVFACRRLEPGR